jgi:osmotically-inducible protein OsmY
MHPDLERIDAADQRLHSRVRLTLRACQCDLPVTIETSASTGTVTLIGAILDDGDKRRLIECVRRVPGVHRIVDQMLTPGELSAT